MEYNHDILKKLCQRTVVGKVNKIFAVNSTSSTTGLEPYLYIIYILDYDTPDPLKRTCYIPMRSYNEEITELREEKIKTLLE